MDPQQPGDGGGLQPFWCVPVALPVTFSSSNPSTTTANQQPDAPHDRTLTAYNPLMANWQIFLFEIGGFGAVLALALVIIGKWFLKQVAATLNSYVAAYALETARTEARMKHLEKLADEQAHLTKTVEGIQDQIAALAKSRDNRWAFRKDVYVRLLNSITDCISVLTQLHDLQTSFPGNSETPDAEMQEKLEDHRIRFLSASATFIRYANVAPLAVADRVLPVLTVLDKQLPTWFSSHLDRTLSLRIVANFKSARDALLEAGRNDLWDLQEPKARAASAT